MASLLEELHRPEVRARLAARSPELLVPHGRWASGQSMALRIFANMMMPSAGERDFLPGEVFVRQGQVRMLAVFGLPVDRNSLSVCQIARHKQNAFICLYNNCMAFRTYQSQVNYTSCSNVNLSC